VELSVSNVESFIVWPSTVMGGDRVARANKHNGATMLSIESDVPAASGEVAAWRGMCGGESRSEVQSGQLRVQRRNPVSFGAGFHTQCNGESFVVCGCAFVVAVKRSESVS